MRTTANTEIALHQRVQGSSPWGLTRNNAGLAGSIRDDGARFLCLTAKLTANFVPQGGREPGRRLGDRCRGLDRGESTSTSGLSKRSVGGLDPSHPAHSSACAMPISSAQSRQIAASPRTCPESSMSGASYPASLWLVTLMDHLVRSPHHRLGGTWRLASRGHPCRNPTPRRAHPWLADSA